MPPALVTAAASSACATPDIPARIIGYLIPSFSVKGVLMVSAMLVELRVVEYVSLLDCVRLLVLVKQD